jgi:uncharacterized membrane protein
MINDVASLAKTLRPSRELYKKAVLRDLLIAVPLFVLIVGSQIARELLRTRYDGDGSGNGLIVFYIALVIAGIAFSFGYYFALMRNSRIDIAATNLTVTNWLGRSRTIDHAEMGTVIQGLLRISARTVPMLFVLDREGKRIFTMYGTLWTPESMVDVGAATPLAPTTFAGPVSYRELRKLYPRAFSWARANPILLAVIVAGGLFLLFVVAMIVLFAVLASQLNV